MEWQNWCRLCGKENGNEINIYIKEKTSDNVAKIIDKFFPIQVNDFDEIPDNICLFCYDFILSLQEYSEKVRQVEKMFFEILLLQKAGKKIDLQEIKTKYKIKTEEDTDYYEIQKNKSSDMYLTENIPCTDNLDISIKRDIEDKDSSINILNNANQSVTYDFEISNHLNYTTTASQDSTLSLNNKKSNNLIDEYEELENYKSNESKQFEGSRKKSKINIESNEKKSICRKYVEEKKNFQCEICKIKFIRESNYAYHLKRTHSLIKPILPCNICGKVCKTKQKLKFHMELHLPPEEREKLLFKCPECNQKFTQKGAMKSHVRAQHSSEKPYICEQCGKKFASQTNLWSHRRSHDDQNHLTCPKCPKIFKNKFRLRVHMRGHTDSCHTCSICGLILKTMNTLKNHMLVHSDAKPFKCNFCGKDFKRDKNLQNHMITHSGLRPFVCRFCGQSYANRSNCKKHEKHSHPKEYETAASITIAEPQQKVVKKLPNIQQLEAMLEQIKCEKGNNFDVQS